MTPDVIASIDSEREYQKKKWGTPEPEHSVAEWILILQKLQRDLDAKWFVYGGTFCMSEVRQIAAVCAAAMEQHGAPLR